MGRKQLLVLGCSATKRKVPGDIPALCLYDGPMYRTIRKYLRNNQWPENLKIAILSAKYGLIGGLTPISYYDQRMTQERARELTNNVTKVLRSWTEELDEVLLFLGKDYLNAVNGVSASCSVVEGPIGVKLAKLKSVLERTTSGRNRCKHFPVLSRPLYFLPDWDDFVDADFDFEADKFSAPKEQRREKHVTELVKPHEKLCDGILVSLAQQIVETSKGALKRIKTTDLRALAPVHIKDFFGLTSEQLVFGDCGAFSYVNEENPPISVEQAVAFYDLYDFDLGASVDHIPAREIKTKKGKYQLSSEERKQRIKLTQENADKFIQTHKEWGAKFIPVGVIQGLTPRDYADQIGLYAEMGYSYVALGGLVPRSDREIEEIVESVHSVRCQLRNPPRIHLLGIFRPELQPLFRRCEISSFDSSTYYRKAWLRAKQNYLGVDGKWYAALRIPPLHTPKILNRLLKTGTPVEELEKLENDGLMAIRAYAKGETGAREALEVLFRYDSLFQRMKDDTDLIRRYEETLTSKIWERCSCPICKKLGIDVVIFRGENRNKRRGAHNTLMLYKQLCKTSRFKRTKKSRVFKSLGLI